MTKNNTNILTLTSFIGLTILLASFFILITTQIYKKPIQSYLVKQNHIIITYSGDFIPIKEEISKIKYLNPLSIKNISRKSIQSKLRLNLNIDSLIINPLLSVDIENFESINALDDAKDSLSKVVGIKDIFINKSVYQDIIKNFQHALIALWLLLILLTLFSFFIIQKNVKYALLEQRQYIQKMKLIGASNFYFKKPFYKAGGFLLFITLILIFISILWIFKYYLNIEIDTPLLLNTKNMIIILSLVLYGLLIIFTSIHFSFKKHLILQDEDLF